MLEIARDLPYNIARNWLLIRYVESDKIRNKNLLNSSKDQKIIRKNLHAYSTFKVRKTRRVYFMNVT